MPTFRVQIETCDVYEKFVEAEDEISAQTIIEGESLDSDNNWDRLESSAKIVSFKKVKDDSK